MDSTCTGWTKIMMQTCWISHTLRILVLDVMPEFPRRERSWDRMSILRPTFVKLEI
ncbi:hypothetical protein HUJ04_000380 [Dendroctonus ponderosae]|nr:hypothetical protein HUJ04_000380 [Dendroctonus ponderosae]